eukprot:958178-Pelagomonas_calceolata.AAC.3
MSMSVSIYLMRMQMRRVGWADPAELAGADTLKFTRVLLQFCNSLATEAANQLRGPDCEGSQ